MESSKINRTAELLGECLWRAHDNNLFWQMAVHKILAEAGSPYQAVDLLIAGEMLTGIIGDRLTGKRAEAKNGPILAPLDYALLIPADFPANPSGSGAKHDYLDEGGVVRHCYRLVAYGALGLPTDPAVASILEETQRDTGHATPV